MIVLAGCWHAPEHSETTSALIGTARLDSEGVDGGEVTAVGGSSGIQVQFAAQVQRITRPGDPQDHFAGGADIGLRASLFGILAKDHRLDHWFDFGAMGGAGGGFLRPADRVTTYGQAWGGAWMQLGVMPGARFLAIFLDARRVIYAGDPEDQTIFGIGIGWVIRDPK